MSSTMKEAGYLLRVVEPEKHFWVNSGPVVGNLEGLEKALNKMNTKTFAHHCNKSKNDFAVWINDVIGDAELAQSIAKVIGKPTLTNMVAGRIAALKKSAKKK